MASQEEKAIEELNKLARIHSRVDSDLSRELPAGAVRLQIHSSHVAAAKKIIINRMKAISDAVKKD